MRANVARYVGLNIEIAAPGEVSRLSDDSIEGFVALLTDKQGEARKYAKNCLSLLQQRNPTAVAAVVSRLDPRTQENLQLTAPESCLDGLDVEEPVMYVYLLTMSS